MEPDTENGMQSLDECGGKPEQVSDIDAGTAPAEAAPKTASLLTPDRKKSQKTFLAVLGVGAVLVVLLVVLAVTLLRSGVSEDSDSGAGRLRSMQAVQTEPQASAQSGAATQTGDVEAPAMTYEAPTPVQPDISVTLAKQEIFNDSGIVVTVTGLEYNTYDVLLTLRVQNKMLKKITMDCEYSTVNGYLVNAFGYENIGMLGTVETCVEYNLDELGTLGISQIAEIDVKLAFWDSDYNDIAETEPITLRTNAYNGYTQTCDESGTILYEADGLKILYQGMELPETLTAGEGIALHFLTENNSGGSITVNTEYVCVDDYAVSDRMYRTIPAGKYLAYTLGIDCDELEDCGISSAGEIELVFSFTDENYTTVGQSGVCVLSTGCDAVQEPPTLEDNACLYDEKDVKIGFLGFYAPENDYDDPEIRLLVENNGTGDVYLWSLEAAVDGTETYVSGMNPSIPAGKSAIVYVSFFYLDYDGIDIGQANTVSLGMEIEIGDEYETIPTYEISLSENSLISAEASS